MKKSALMGLACLLLAACGQTGPLYLPEPGNAENAGESTQATE